MTRPSKANQPTNWPFGQSELGIRLIASLDGDRLPVTMLFAGPAGLGKRAAGSWLAQYDLCQGQAVKPCGICLSCRQFNSHQHPNFVQLQSLDQAPLEIDLVRRTLEVRRLRLAPGQHHWIVIPEAERLTENAANALLKFLEEPPEGFHCLLTTAAPDRLPLTITSRCAIYYWHLAARQEIDRQVGATRSDRRAMTARAAGRPSWLAPYIADENALVEEEQQVKAFIRTNIQNQAADLQQLIGQADGSSIEIFDRWEIWWRELMLIKTGAWSRLLWPRLRGELASLAVAMPLAAVLAKIQKMQTRHELIKQHLTPKTIATYLIIG